MRSSTWLTLIALLFLVSILLRLGLLFLLAVLLLLVLGVSWLWNRYCLAGVTYGRRLLQTRLFLGEEGALEVEMSNLKPLPLPWLKVEDEFPEGVTLLTGRLHAHYLPRRWWLVNLVAVRWYERVRRRYRLQGAERGVYHFGPARLSSGDIFGLARQMAEMEGVDELVVYPKVVPVTRLVLPAERPFGEFRSPRRLVEDPLQFMSVRDYVPGDPFRHMHWKATARTWQLQTRVYEPTTTRQLLLFLDVQTTPRVYLGYIPEYLELAVTAAASIASHALETGYQVGLYANTAVRFARDLIRVPPSRDPAQLANVLTALAQVTYFNHRPIEAILEREAFRLPFGATIVVISALQTEGLAPALLDLARTGHPVTILTIGDERPSPIIPGVRVYPLGGRLEWHEFEKLELA